MSRFGESYVEKLLQAANNKTTKGGDSRAEISRSSKQSLKKEEHRKSYAEELLEAANNKTTKGGDSRAKISRSRSQSLKEEDHSKPSLKKFLDTAKYRTVKGAKITRTRKTIFEGGGPQKTISEKVCEDNKSSGGDSREEKSRSRKQSLKEEDHSISFLKRLLQAANNKKTKGGDSRAKISRSRKKSLKEEDHSKPSLKKLLEAIKYRTVKGRNSRGKMSRSRKRSLDEVDYRKPSPEKQPEAAKNKKPKVHQPQRTQHGLYNQGATCYLNSVLQVLYRTPEIHERLEPKDQRLKEFFDKLTDTTCETENITRSLEITNVYQQRDAPECLEMILRKVSPEASEVFEGQLSETTKCPQGHIIIEETNPFWTLPLSLKGTHGTTYSVEESFERIFQTESFSGDNMAFCNTCKMKTEATSESEMVKFPQILALILSRIELDLNTMSYIKSDCNVNVPLTLKKKKKKYSLYGMVNHWGSTRGGHYTATILCDEDQTWYEFNDHQVSKVEEQPFAKGSTYYSRTAYLLVYRALSHKEEPKRKSRKGEADDEENLITVIVNKDDDLPPNQNTSLTRQDNLEAERRKQGSETETGAKCPKPCESLTDYKMIALIVFLILLGCVLFVILPVVLTMI